MTNRSIAFVAMLSVSASILGVITPLQAQVETEKSSDLASGLTLIPTDANIIVYREYAEPIIWASTVKVDGEKVAALTNRRIIEQITVSVLWQNRKYETHLSNLRGSMAKLPQIISKK